MKVINVLIVLTVFVGIFSCKKEKKDQTVSERFIGLWVENSTKRDTLVITEGENSGVLGPMLFLHSQGKAYPFQYRFNNAQDSVILSDLSASSTLRHNVPYKLIFSENQFTIKKFHPALPDIDPLIFSKVR